MCKKYIAITIGPIFDTINLTSSPAALWAASYMFSSLTKTICEILTQEYNVPEEQIVTPYYSASDSILNGNNGIGLFHDRIIFRADSFDLSKMPEVREKAIKAINEKFKLSDETYLSEYVMIAYTQYTADNPILESTALLNSLELSKPFVFEETRNPILSLFTNSDANSASNTEETDQEQAKVGKNKAVKKLIAGFKGFQLEKFRNRNGDVVLKSLTDITYTGRPEYKRSRYYAILRADGDNMGKIIAGLTSDKEIRDFSRKCLDYCSAIAERVGKYGGITIYSGGDDLLAILPCEKDGATVFDFLKAANEIFAKHFSTYQLSTSLSFGVLIAYNRFPLYEALSASADLLFGHAKNVKNCTTISQPATIVLKQFYK